MIAINLHSQKEPKKTKYYGKGLRTKQLFKKKKPGENVQNKIKCNKKGTVLKAC